jgi:hypothetical protein
MASAWLCENYAGVGSQNTFYLQIRMGCRLRLGHNRVLCFSIQKSMQEEYLTVVSKSYPRPIMSDLLKEGI